MSYANANDNTGNDEKKALFDDVLHQVGDLGLWHAFVYSYLAIYSVIGAWINLNVVFMSVVPNHECTSSNATAYVV